MNQFLQKNGFVVISGYISQEQADKYNKDIWETVENLSDRKIDRNKRTTWKDLKNYPPFLRGGMYHYIGHSPVLWHLRKKARLIFEYLWKTKQLKSSFDGFCFMNGQLNYQKKQLRKDLHVDQHPSNLQLWSYQGIQTLTDANQNGGGFICVPKSHKFYFQYFKDQNLIDHKGSYNVPQKDMNDQNLRNCIKVNTKAGDFIIFDSRTFHGNTLPKEKTLRIATYICMIPKQAINQQTLQLRKKAFIERRNSTHYPGNGFRTFDLLPRNYSQLHTQIESEKFLKLIKEVNNVCLENDQEIMDLV